jgi:Zn-dependent protease with chaperone function
MTTLAKFLFIWLFHTAFFSILASSADPDAPNDVFKAQLMADAPLFFNIAAGWFVFTAVCLLIARRREANHFADTGNMVTV